MAIVKEIFRYSCWFERKPKKHLKGEVVMKKETLLALCVIGLLGAGLASADTYDPDMTFLAHLDDGPGSWDADFALGNGTGTANSCSSVTGKFGTAADIAGTLSYSSVNHLNLTQSTVEFWMNRNDDGSSTVTPWRWRKGYQVSEFKIWHSGSTGTVYFDTYDDSKNRCYTTVNPGWSGDDFTEWHHIAATWKYDDVTDKITVKLSVDGVTNSNSRTGVTYSDRTTTVFNPGTPEVYIDEIRMLNEYRSSTDLAADAAMTVPFTPEPTTLALLAVGAILLKRRR
jgi:hypothetical protein